MAGCIQKDYHGWEILRLEQLAKRLDKLQTECGTVISIDALVDHKGRADSVLLVYSIPLQEATTVEP